MNKESLRVAALGGGHGLPSVLRALKPYTPNLTAIVTVADDGGSSGKLRRELGVIPPGDLRNNIAALADDEALMTHLFQYRFSESTAEGHSLGNLLLAALTNITGSMVKAVAEAGHVLKIKGTVLPASLQNVVLCADILDESGVLQEIQGESLIGEATGRIQRVRLTPSPVRAYPETLRAILSAEVIIFGPGSLYTSTLPSLLVDDIANAIRASEAPRLYICNIATQRETTGFTVADHIKVLEDHIGEGLIDMIICNDHYPTPPPDSATHYVPLTDFDRERLAHYRILTADLTGVDQPWRHDSTKLAAAIFQALEVLST